MGEGQGTRHRRARASAGMRNAMRPGRGASGACVVLATGLALVGACASGVPDEGDTEWTVVRRVFAGAARQGVAVSRSAIYAIDDRRIDKLHRGSGETVDGWEGALGGPVVHLNGGIVRDDVLWCAHSNYPELPMRSSIERFDADTLERLAPDRPGRDGRLRDLGRPSRRPLVGGLRPLRGARRRPRPRPRAHDLVRYDDAWHEVARYGYPPELIRRLAGDTGHSNSGGAFGPDGRLYLTGHDAAEIHVARVPDAGPTLAWEGTLPAPIEGQGIAWAPPRWLGGPTLFGVVRSRLLLVELRPTRR